ncbi:MAG TPA: hypothetical protein VIK01_19005, partial [Polyangiaceae bacterium]
MLRLQGALLFSMACALGACPKPHADTSGRVEKVEPTAVESGSAEPPPKVAEPLPNERVDIPGGSFN